MCYVRKMSLISYFQNLLVVRRREGEQRRRLLLAAALLGKKNLGLSPPARATEHTAFVTCWESLPSYWPCRDQPDGPALMRKKMAQGLQERLHSSLTGWGHSWAKKTAREGLARVKHLRVPSCLICNRQPSGQQHCPNFGGRSPATLQPSHTWAIGLPRECICVMSYFFVIINFFQTPLCPHCAHSLWEEKWKISTKISIVPAAYPTTGYGF